MSLEIVDMPGVRPLPPRLNGFTARFWHALPQGELLATRCQACDRATFPPRQHCRGCGAAQMQWFALCGDAVVYSQTTIHAAPSQFVTDIPFTLAIVDLNEELRMLTRLLGADSRNCIGKPARMVITRYSDGCMFAARAGD